MQITEIRIYKPETIREGSLYRGSANITLDGAIAIHGIAIVEGEKGLFVSFPSKRRSDGERMDIVHPINQETRESIQKLILDKYAES